MHWVSMVATVIAGAVVAGILWWAFGRVRLWPMKALIAIGTALPGFALFCLIQTGLEVLHPADQINGHLIAYDTNIFLALLVVIEAAMLWLRNNPKPMATS